MGFALAMTLLVAPSIAAANPGHAHATVSAASARHAGGAAASHAGLLRRAESRVQTLRTRVARSPFVRRIAANPRVRSIARAVAGSPQRTAAEHITLSVLSETARLTGRSGVLTGALGGLGLVLDVAYGLVRPRAVDAAKPTTTAGRVRYWLGEHGLQVLSVAAMVARTVNPVAGLVATGVVVGVTAWRGARHTRAATHHAHAAP